MDFLDPRKRRAYHIRLAIGYILVAIVIGLGTVIIVYGANGYGINTKTGQIVENGLLFVNSNPGAAEIYLNGKDKHATSPARLILPAGNYSLTLKKNGYRDWSRKFTLGGQSVARYDYAFLFPVKPVAANLKNYATKPGIFTESPDRRWLLVQNNSASAKSPVFDEYDTKTLDNTSPSTQQISLPAGVLTKYSAKSKLSVVEWSTDNNNLLLRHTYSGGSEFVIFNRARPDQSFNVNKLFTVSPSQVSLYNKSAAQLYIYDKADGSLRLGTVSSKTLAVPVLTQVLAYKPYGRNLITYVTNKGEPAGKVMTGIWDSGKTYRLNELDVGGKYLIDAAQYQGHFYYIAGSTSMDHINVYKDPLNDIKNPVLGKSPAILALPDKGARVAGFSDNARFVGIESGQSFSVYDFQTDSAYRYKIKNPLSASLAWMDGNRYIGDSHGKILVIDCDGTNQQLLASTSFAEGGLFSGDYKHLLTLTPSSNGKSIVLQDVDMRAGTDLPKK